MIIDSYNPYNRENNVQKVLDSLNNMKNTEKGKTILADFLRYLYPKQTLMLEGEFAGSYITGVEGNKFFEYMKSLLSKRSSQEQMEAGEILLEASSICFGFSYIY
jgi:E3 ubiquitin-protein ligase DOA10